MPEPKTRPAPVKCVYPECHHTSRTRGLCHGHYQLMRARVRAGHVDPTDLERRGLLLPVGEGSSGVGDDLDAFRTGSKVTGDAPSGIDRYFARILKRGYRAV